VPRPTPPITFAGARAPSPLLLNCSPENRRQSSRTTHADVQTSSFEGLQAARETALADRVKNHVIDVAGSREILSGVVD
jgi:hypothetical protein